LKSRFQDSRLRKQIAPPNDDRYANQGDVGAQQVEAVRPPTVNESYLQDREHNEDAAVSGEGRPTAATHSYLRWRKANGSPCLFIEL